jgi:hypothetical protein
MYISGHTRYGGNGLLEKVRHGVAQKVQTANWNWKFENREKACFDKNLFDLSRFYGQKMLAADRGTSVSRNSTSAVLLVLHTSFTSCHFSAFDITFAMKLV